MNVSKIQTSTYLPSTIHWVIYSLHMPRGYIAESHGWDVIRTSLAKLSDLVSNGGWEVCYS